jgi:hypothetical protein
MHGIANVAADKWMALSAMAGRPLRRGGTLRSLGKRGS